MNNSPKKIIVFAGPSGVGKSTLSRILVDEFSQFEFSISATTRNPRGKEKDGVDYYFLSEEKFRKGIINQDFIEYEEVYPGRYYGTLQSEVKRITDLGKKAIFDIDVLGALNIKKQFKEQVCIILVKPESIRALVERLRARGTDSEQEIIIRKNRFEKELSFEKYFDEVIVNTTGDIKSAKKQLLTVIKKHF